ncbi:hypothetical protein KAFR_0E02160 [Kazachstania africana CBS 2517]|uniref:Topoisomerase I damage affected protein 11 n=1 Tax=Kazachstania africana (strain ATCC 22294 / BCRC 22015 / CBS 2517 / CECT 1963 / NBRC 1671 / NRRL Y-8276) TaxID=1071382 RepID=H2AVG9_KAZAF|nr:hypothetical protein KAFR_0E02160 [Kazachstania africana CBS 2517]CCF58369.1 hypothetical protein KAFR_0E02160 [Kazachstania africana CBS 2517]
MNKFDEFIQETDNVLDIDTSTRDTTGQIAPKTNDTSKIQSKSPISKSRHTTSPVISSNSKFLIQKQLTPTKVDETVDHPLRGSPNSHRAGTVISAPSSEKSTRTRPRKPIINKRRSLIQPLITHSQENTFEIATQVSTLHLNERQHSSTEHDVSNTNTQNSKHSRGSSTNSLTIDTNDINMLLKNLANKEMDLFESKQKIDDLRKQLLYHEKLYERHSNELKNLKAQVSKHLTDNVSGTSTPMKSQNGKNQTETSEKIKYTNNALETRGKTNKIEEVKDIINKQETHKKSISKLEPEAEKSQANGSVWSKPLAIFNQFDQILQQELEKSLNWDSETSPEKEPAGKDGTYMNEGKSNIFASDLGSDYNYVNINSATTNDDTGTTNGNSSSVSKSIWNFVNDVRTGLLGIDEEISEEEEEGFKNQTNDSSENGQLIKEFKTTKKSARSSGNKLNFIDNDEDHEVRDVEMTTFL